MTAKTHNGLPGWGADYSDAGPGELERWDGVSEERKALPMRKGYMFKLQEPQCLPGELPYMLTVEHESSIDESRQRTPSEPCRVAPQEWDYGESVTSTTFVICGDAEDGDRQALVECAMRHLHEGDRQTDATRQRRVYGSNELTCGASPGDIRIADVSSLALEELGEDMEWREYARTT